MNTFHGARTFICYAISPCTQLTKQKPNQTPIWKWTMHEKLDHQSDTASLKSHFLMNDYSQVFRLASMRWLELARPKLSSKIYVWHTSAERQFTRESARSQKSGWPRAVQCPTIVTRMLGLPTGINRHVLQLTLLFLMSP